MKTAKKAKENSPLIYVVAGEPSGDILAARLIEALRKKNKSLRFAGVGGENMRDQGVDSLFPIRDLAVMGLLEVVPSIPRILRRMDEVLEDIKRLKPAVVITVDSFSFSVRLLKRIRKERPKIKRIHYVAPQVWAWKEYRAKQMKGLLDHLLMLLPFEAPYFEKYDVPCTFVGHPVLESGADKGSKEWFLKKHPVEGKILCLLPGSRRSETTSLLPVYQEMLSLLKRRGDTLTVVVPTVESVVKDVKSAVKSWPYKTIVIEGQKNRYDAFAAADAAVCASGTVALEAVMAHLPHVITYKLSFATYLLLRLMTKIRYADLINLMAGKEIIPELLQGKCNPRVLATYAAALLSGPRDVPKEALAVLARMRAGQTSPSDKAAETVLKCV